MGNYKNLMTTCRKVVADYRITIRKCKKSMGKHIYHTKVCYNLKKT